ncbi:MAG: HDOD domain-containing protein [Betaproteobacteria bacterium]|nr:HDOD domain-containing protein [Betaproteobacteria bacterium]
MLAASAPKKINRFEIQRTLGAGAQGTVYLARDTRLNRRVAIKTPVVGGKAEEHRRRVDTLLAEARMVSQLSHPNVVPLFDAGEESELPFLVFEYVEGTVLSQMIKRERRLSPSRAVAIAVELLAALGYAHHKGVMHRDIKPGNIMLTADGGTRVMDFGIAQRIADNTPDTPDGLRGTPCYLAPEYVNSGLYTPRCDLYSAGVVLYEMLTGRPAVNGRNVFEILHRAANESIAAPSTLNPEVDEKLDDLVFKALAPQPERRYASAEEMEEALREYLDPAASADGPGADASGTLEFLLRRMRHKSDFPALSNTISTINRVTGSADENASALSNTILKDFALTNKLLRLVNTAYFGQYGGTISTVSRAVVILGFDRIRSVAMTLMLMEHLQNKAQAAQLKEDVVAGYFSGLLARELVAKANIRDGEEAFICTVFHDLGRLLARFYLVEEALQIDRLVEQGTADEKQASLKVLGISFEELGVGVARAWNFPERMVQSMRKLPDEQVRRPSGAEDRLRAIAELSSNLCATLRESDARARDQRMHALVAKFGKGLNVTPQTLETAIQQSMLDLKRDAAALDLRAADGFLARVALAVKAEKPTAGQTRTDQLQTAIEHATLTTPVAALPEEGAPRESNRKALLTAGIQDITNALVSDYQLNDVLRIILEAMYRGMGFTRVLLCVRDPSTHTLKGRFGFGANIDEIIRKGFGIPIGGSRDVFQAAITNGADILIEDTEAESIRSHVPDWFRKLIPAQSFVLFPILINKKPIGMLYGDADAAGRLKIPADELALLKTLRNQAVLAIRQHSS